MSEKQNNKLSGFFKTVGHGIHKAANAIGKAIHDHPIASTFVFLGLTAIGTGAGIELAKEGTGLATALMGSGGISLSFVPLAATNFDNVVHDKRKNQGKDR